MRTLPSEDRCLSDAHFPFPLSLSERGDEFLFYLLAFISLCNSWAVMATHPQTGRVVLATNEPGTSLIFLPGDPAGYTVELVMPLPDALFLN
jgi:hypothetical protein